MPNSIDISREEWLKELQELSPSSQAYDAYVELEQFTIEHTVLLRTYRRNRRGQSHYATFNGSAAGHCSVIQILAGRCELIWHWKKPIPGATLEQHARVNVALDHFRRSLDGSPGKSWEHVKILSLGISRVQEALRTVSVELDQIVSEIA